MELGQKAKDVITGFEGTITGIVTYLTGCKQVLITGQSKDGKPADSTWFDETRIKILNRTPVKLPTQHDNGCDSPAPKK